MGKADELASECIMDALAGWMDGALVAANNQVSRLFL
jgi:monoamine oxidase